MDPTRFQDVQDAVAEQRAALEVDRLVARRLVTRGDIAASRYIRSGSRWLFRGLAAVYLGALVAGLALLVSGRFLYAALTFLVAVVLQQLWGGLAVDLLQMIALRDRSFLGLALREGWITLIEPPVAPGRRTRPLDLQPSADGSAAAYIAEVDAARKILAEHPDDAQLRFDLGVTYLLAGEFDKALEESRILSMLDARLATKLQDLTRLLAN